MRLPVFEEIKLVEFDEDSLRCDLKKAKLGKTPYYIDLTGRSPDEAQETATILERLLYELNVSPLFPYPIYLVSPHAILTEKVPLVESVDELPKYFKVKQGTTGNKEGSILKKIELKKEAIHYLEIDPLIEKARAMREQNKKLYQLARVGHFYADLIKRLSSES